MLFTVWVLKATLYVYITLLVCKGITTKIDHISPGHEDGVESSRV